MDEPPEWRVLAGIGVVLVLQSLLDGGPAGPWDDPSFSRGLGALSGGVMLYIAWYRWTFERRGLIPYLHLWDDVRAAIPKLAIAGFAGIFLARLMGSGTLLDLPAPMSMFTLLIGCLLLLLAAYAWLVTGPLSLDVEEE